MRTLVAVATLVCLGLPASGFAQAGKAPAGAAAHGAHDAAALKDMILALEKKRVAAMVNKDIPTLSSILADDLTYTHSGGRTDSKAAFVALIAGPDNRYLGVDYSNTEVITNGNAVIVRGIAQIRLGAGPRGPATSYPVIFTDVYMQRNGAWQMVAWHATRPEQK